MPLEVGQVVLLPPYWCRWDYDPYDGAGFYVVSAFEKTANGTDVVVFEALDRERRNAVIAAEIVPGPWTTVGAYAGLKPILARPRRS